MSGGRRARSVAGSGTGRLLAARVPPRARRAGRALPTCPESRPVPIPHTPPPLPRVGPGGRRRRRDSVSFPPTPRGGERSGHDAKRGRRGNRDDSSPSRGRPLAACPPQRRGGGGGGKLADICRFWGLRGLDVDVVVGRGDGTVSPGPAGRGGPRVTPACLRR